MDGFTACPGSGEGIAPSINQAFDSSIGPRLDAAMVGSSQNHRARCKQCMVETS